MRLRLKSLVAIAALLGVGGCERRTLESGAPGAAPDLAASCKNDCDCAQYACSQGQCVPLDRKRLCPACQTDCDCPIGYGCAAYHECAPMARAAACPLVCLSDKIAFTQASGCANDGSVEFCIPVDNAFILSSVQSIAPTVSCRSGGGRAGCATGGLLLCTLPTAAPTQCATAGGAMTDSAWQQICRLSDLPDVPRIVPTRVE